MCKWWWKLENEEGPWQHFMRKKYLGDTGIQWAKHRKNDSPLWKDMMHVRDIYLCGRRMAVGNGCRTSFWKDAWCGHTPLMDKFPDLYNICNEQTISVADAAHVGWRLSFRRWLSEDLQRQWCGLVNILNQRGLSDTVDKPKWKWTKSRQFTVKSVYKQICRNGIDRSFKHLWKSKIPLKIKIWLWLIWHNAIATKDNLLKRNWNGDPLCEFCSTHESILHLFFSCPAAQYIWSLVGMTVGAPTRPGSFAQFFWWMPQFSNANRNVQIAGIAAICWAIWKTRNSSCFEKKTLKNPVDLIFLATSFMKYWAGAHSDTEAAQLQQGAAALINLALGAGGGGGAGNAMVVNQQLRLEQGDATMDIDAQDNADADADNMQT
jgi:hypothetical protein